MNELHEIIKALITAKGKITFAEFMELALYYPGLGYYASSRQRVGADGDFYTSPATHPVFAALIAVQMEQMWRLMDSPERFDIVEMGAGKGLLARDILSFLPKLSSSFRNAVSYYAAENNANRVFHYDHRGAKIIQEIVETIPAEVCGCFISNELIDALPTHLVTVQRGRLREVYVTFEGDDFSEVTGTLSTPGVESRLAREGIVLPEGYRTEVNLELDSVFSDMAYRLRKGFVITIDYGYPAGELYSPEKSSGTLMTYYRHNCGSNPYIRVGYQDITSHVDFTAAIHAGESGSLETIALISQRDFLANLGIHSFMNALARRGLPNQEHMANRYAMQELIREDGMGSFRVLLQSKGVCQSNLYGTNPENEWKQDLKTGRLFPAVPLLDSEHTPLLEGKYPHLDVDADVW